jgi:benzil reductase ((S)-benzoin forming)
MPMPIKVAIVTGVSRGLGFGIAKHLLQSGYSVVGFGLSDNADLKKVALQFGMSYDFHELDFLDLPLLESLMKKVFATISAAAPESVTLINNAAIVTPIGQLKDLDSIKIQEGMTVNLIAPILLSKVFMASFEKSPGRKRIIHISSGAVVRTLPGSNVYCIAKAGLEMLVKAIDSESQYLASPVESIAFRPGLVDTDMQTSLRKYSPKELPIVDMYLGFKEQNLLRHPDAVAKILTDKLIDAKVESGRIYSIDEFV